MITKKIVKITKSLISGGDCGSVAKYLPSTQRTLRLVPHLHQKPKPTHLTKKRCSAVLSFCKAVRRPTGILRIDIITAFPFHFCHVWKSNLFIKKKKAIAEATETAHWVSLNPQVLHKAGHCSTYLYSHTVFLQVGGRGRRLP